MVVGEESALEKLAKDLRGGSLQIRHDPSDPTISLLADYTDSRFGGLQVSQNPDWLNQASTFDLQDVLRS